MIANFSCSTLIIVLHRCAFAAFGGIFFGYDSGYINGVTGSKVFIELIEGPGQTSLSSSHNSLIVSILSAGTFFGRLRQVFKKIKKGADRLTRD